ncbi:pre-B-cell leukemia homeobox interacting protein 1b isoform X3 [Amphiprion ocellaris]|uniref:pre-B-cell leukemia homeobox interacting protein 1b isoform X3 n=1 Tax=Amphiprion ocellaris TaxID=80972 RepID=UPI002411885C|nr:pre-B-cell leukemia homeobox interacting protein 1b isoform X3 [Amphiprion ocellaris]
MSGGSGANNSWTILSSEETVAETLRPLAEGTEQNEENQTTTAGCGENIQPANAAEPAEGLAVQDDTVSEEKPAELSEASEPTAVTEAPSSSTVEASDSSVHEVGQTEGSPEGPTELGPDPDSSSDSYTCITSSPDEPPASLLSTETVGSAEFAPDEEKLDQEETLHHLNGEELHLEGEESEHQRSTDLGKQAVYLVDQLVLDLFSIWARRLSGEAVVDSPPDSEVGEKTGEEGEPEVRRRRSLLAALERVGRREEEEEEEEDEDFQVPQREEDSGFSVNKCILGAVILLGLGTIFFSESDYGPAEMKGAEVPGKQEWLNPEAPPPPVDADSSQLLNKLAEGSQQISVLQAQLQAQKEELKVAKGQAAEGAKERRHWEEVEKENSRLKTEMASLPVLQKENERMKKDLESVPALQKELETLRSTVTELKLSSAAEHAAHVKPTTSPPTGQSEDSRQAKKPWDDQKEKKKKVKYDMGEKKEWKEKSAWKEEDKKERKDGGKKEWKKEKHEQGTFDKEGKHKQQSDEAKQWKKEKTSRGDEGKPWKNREGKKEWIGKDEKKEWKEEKERKKVKHEKVNEGKQWKGGKDYEERHKGKAEWKGEKEWKKVKDGLKESGKEKWERKDWKEKGEKKEWKKESEWRDNKEKGERKHWEGGKNHGKERSGKDERKQWNEQELSKNRKHDKEWKRKDEKEEEWKRGKQKEKKHSGDGKKEKWEKSNKFAGNHIHEEEHLYTDGKQSHSHRKPSLDQPEYWQQQKDRLQHNPRPPQHCSSLETCAQAERLRPVALPDFQAILQMYLAKAEEAGVDESKREELRKLVAEFFKDGVFAHDQMSFQEFVEDIGDILEDMVEGDEEDSAIEEEMEAFEREVMEKFLIPGEKEERIKSEWRKEAERGRG